MTILTIVNINQVIPERIQETTDSVHRIRKASSFHDTPDELTLFFLCCKMLKSERGMLRMLMRIINGCSCFSTECETVKCIKIYIFLKKLYLEYSQDFLEESFQVSVKGVIRETIYLQFCDSIKENLNFYETIEKLF